MSRNQFKKQRKRLFLEHPYCFWCKKPLILIDSSSGQLPNNAATIDHIFSKLHSGRKLSCNNINRHVLSCYRCNHLRSKQEMKVIYLKQSSKLPLDRYSYRERKYRLDLLNNAIERGIDHLIGVMGKPVRENIYEDTSGICV